MENTPQNWKVMENSTKGAGESCPSKPREMFHL